MIRNLNETTILSNWYTRTLLTYTDVLACLIPLINMHWNW